MTGKLKALVVGINNYGSPQNNLPSCVNDAKTFTKVLVEEYGFRFGDIRSLYDTNATRARVEQELEWLFDDVEEEDRVVFYYSGHGYTKYMDGEMEEFLVLRDGLWQDNRLSKMTQNLPPDVLTVILDSCFSGGMLKLLADPTGAGEDIEVTRSKVWTGAPPGEVEKEFMPEERPVISVKRFGMANVVSPRGIAKVLRPEAFPFPVESPYLTLEAEITSKDFQLTELLQTTETQAKAAGQEDEPNQLEMKGLLISACLPDETAAASTSRTKGLSAFTYGLVETLRPGDPADEVLKASALLLNSLKFRQTPMVLESRDPGDLKHRSFITFEDAAMKVAADEKFWEAFANVLPDLVSTVAPTILNALVGRNKSLPQELSDPENAEKFWGGIARALPSLIRVVAPMVVDGLTKGQIKSSSVVQGGMDTVEPEGTDKFWGAIATILPSVISAVAPMVINAVAGRGKSTGWETKSWAAEEVTPEEEKIFWDGTMTTLGPWVQSCMPVIRNAMLGRMKGFSTIRNGGGPVADEKFWGAIASVIPSLIQAAAPIIIDVVSGARGKAQTQAAYAGEERNGAAYRTELPIDDTWQAIGDETTQRSITASVGEVVRNAMSGQTPGFRPIIAPIAGEEDEKLFWGSVASIVRPIISACTPIIIDALNADQTKEAVRSKSVVIKGEPSSVPDEVIRDLMRTTRGGYGT